MRLLNKSALAPLAKAEARLRAAEIAVSDAEHDLESVRRNMAELTELRAQHATEHPKDDQAALEPAAAALLANPKAPRAPWHARLLKGVAKHEDAQLNWVAEAKQIEQAIRLGGNRVDKLRRELEALRAQLQRARHEFANAAYPALAQEFEEQLLILHDRIYAPLRALESFAEVAHPTLRPVKIEMGERVIFPRQQTNRFTPPKHQPIPYRALIRDEDGEYKRDADGNLITEERTMLNEQNVSPAVHAIAADPGPFLDKFRQEIRAERG